MSVFNQLWESIAETTPRILLALVILIVGWIAARVLSKALFVLLARTSLEEWSTRQLGVKASGKYGHRMERVIAKTVFYGLLVVVLVLVLNVLDLQTINQPLINLIDQLILALPKVLLAGIIVLVAFMIGKFASFGLVKGLNAARFDDRMGRFGGIAMGEKLSLSKSVGDLAFWFVMVIGVIQGLSALDMEIFVEPLQGALNEFGQVLPNLVGGTLILLVGYFFARFVGRLIANFLAGVGFDECVFRLGLIPRPVALGEPDSTNRDEANAPDEDGTTASSTRGALHKERRSETEPGNPRSSDEAPPGPSFAIDVQVPRMPSKLVGLAIAVVLFLLVLAQVLSIIHLEDLSDLLPIFILYLAKVAMALVILGAGIWAGNWTKVRIDDYYARRAEGPQRFFGTIARIALIVFASAMGLQQLGVAPGLIVTAFGILFGAVCLALALAFGLGGRTVAGEWVRQEYHKHNPTPAPEKPSNPARDQPTDG